MQDWPVERAFGGIGTQLTTEQINLKTSFILHPWLTAMQKTIMTHFHLMPIVSSTMQINMASKIPDLYLIQFKI